MNRRFRVFLTFQTLREEPVCVDLHTLLVFFAATRIASLEAGSAGYLGVAAPSKGEARMTVNDDLATASVVSWKIEICA